MRTKKMYFLVLVVLLMMGCNNNRYRSYDNWTWPEEDSLEMDEDTVVVERAQEAEKEVKEVSSAFSRSTTTSRSTYRGDDYVYENDGHPGTKPDDGMFGFDYWDDVDDIYNDDRNQTDPYPDQDDW